MSSFAKALVEALDLVFQSPRRGIDWARVRKGCPRCGDKIQYHSLTAWCLSCGWAKNWDPEEDE